MAANKYISIVGDHEQEVLPAVISAGVGDANKIVALDSTGHLDPSVLPSGITPDQLAGTSNGTITAKDLCYVETAGTITRASAAAGTPHVGLGWALTSVATGQPIVIQLQGIITGLSGLTPGARYFLSNTTPGGIIIGSSAPSATGELWQYIGTALTATTLQFEPDTASATLRA